MSKTKSRLDFYKKKIDDSKSKYGGQDDRDWKCTLNKEGKGYAIIRFLDKNQFDDNPDSVPWIERYRHQFKGPNGGYYNELCRSTPGIGEFSDDPVNVLTQPLWKGSEKDKKIAAQRKRKKEFWSNVYIVRDPGNPENEGKVFRFKYGVKIWAKLEALMNPEFEHEEAIDPFDIQNGANFILAIGRVDDFPNYDKCKFEPPSPLVEGSEAQKKILAQCHDLSELVNPVLFKSYDELEKKYLKVVGEAPRGSSKAVADEEDDEPKASPTSKHKVEDADDVDIDAVMNG